MSTETKKARRIVCAVCGAKHTKLEAPTSTLQVERNGEPVYICRHHVKGVVR